MQRCQDKAQEGLPASPSPKEIEKAQSLLAGCAADCAQVCVAVLQLAVQGRPLARQGAPPSANAPCVLTSLASPALQQEYEKQVPKLKADVLSRFKGLR